MAIISGVHAARSGKNMLADCVSFELLIVFRQNQRMETQVTVIVIANFLQSLL